MRNILVSVSLWSIIHSYLLHSPSFTLNTSSVSVSLWSIIHSYRQTKEQWYQIYNTRRFPSPYGVSFILIGRYALGEDLGYNPFPSPYGVSFILIPMSKFIKRPEEVEFPSPYGVSFILI